MRLGEERPDLSGTVIDGRYRLLTKCEGRAHPVIERYEADQLGLGRRVEVEILRASNGEDEALEERFKKNAELMARFDHACFVPVFDSGVFQGCPYVVRAVREEMMSLEDLLSQRTVAWSVDQVAGMLGDLAEAIAELHRCSVALRRLTASEVLVAPEGRARIVDLRAARERFEVGSEEADPRSDLFVLGEIGRAIIPGEGPHMIGAARARLLSLLDRLCAKDIEERPATAALVATALRAIAHQAEEPSEGDTILDGMKPVVVTSAHEREPEPEREREHEREPVQDNAWKSSVPRIISLPPAEAPPTPQAAQTAQSAQSAKSAQIAQPATQSLLDLSFIHSRWRIAVARAYAIAETAIRRAVARNMTMAIAAAAGVILALAFTIVAKSNEPTNEPTAEASEHPPIASAELAASARERANRGETASAISDLERALVEENRYGDAILHAALAHAYVRADRAADSLQHFAIAIRHDASALQDTDIAELVGQLSLPKKDGDRAAELAVELGPRAVPALTDVVNDKSSDKQLRARSQRALRAISSRAGSVARSS